MSDPQILTVRPEPGECAWTFGGAPPVAHIESDTHLISTGSARPMEDAFRISQLSLVPRLVRDYGFAELDAYQCATQAVESPLANGCDTDHTYVRCRFPHVGPPLKGDTSWNEQGHSPDDDAS